MHIIPNVEEGGFLVFDIQGEKVALVTDTSCDLSDEQLTRYDISMVSLRVVASTGEFRDRTEINQEEMYDLLKTELPKTSLPLPEDIIALYGSLRDRGCTRVLHISISAGLSGTYNMCRMLAEEAEGIRVDVVDSRTLSCGLGLLVLTAAEMLEAGHPVEEVIAALEEKRKTQLGCFVIRTLEYLRKGGRIGLVEGVVGSILQIKPVIYVNPDGVYQTLNKARGFGNAIETMFMEFVRRYQGRPVRLAVVHGNSLADAEKFLERLKEKLDVCSAFISPVSPVLAIHTGPGLVGAIVQDA